MKLLIKKGLDIPIKGAFVEELSLLPPSKLIACNLDPFDHLRFSLLAREGEKVKIGTPLVVSKEDFLSFVSPGSGTIKEIRRGLKRRITDIVIERDEKDEYQEHGSFDFRNRSKKELMDFLRNTGAFAHIRARPFDLTASPRHEPKNIFIKAIETLPFVPAPYWQVKGKEEFFQKGIDALSVLTDRIHLVCKENDSFWGFAKGVEHHTIQGPHPAGNLSYAIEQIAPIRSLNDVVWTLSAIDVVIIGRLVSEGHYHTERVVALAGEGFKPEKRKLYKTFMGYPIAKILDFLEDGNCRILSGDPLMGTEVSEDDFLHFGHTSITTIKRKEKREFLHFFRLGKNKYTATRTYLSGIQSPPKEGYSFTTNQHGEHRPFIDGGVYKGVMPLKIPTMELIKAILAEDFEFAEQLGLLEVAPEDFALPSFICPSKTEMIDIVKKGLRRHAQEMGF